MKRILILGILLLAVLAARDAWFAKKPERTAAPAERKTDPAADPLRELRTAEGFSKATRLGTGAVSGEWNRRILRESAPSGEAFSVADDDAVLQRGRTLGGFFRAIRRGLGITTGEPAKSEPPELESSAARKRGADAAERRAIRNEAADVRFSRDGRVLLEYPPDMDEAVFRIPDGVEAVGRGAFRGCVRLKTLLMPDSLREIRDYGFLNCRNLRQIRFGKGLERIGDGAFGFCVELQSANPPDSLREIGAEAFAHCESLRSFRVPPGVQEIRPRTFLGCASLRTVELHENCRRIGAEAFLNCRRLRRLSPWIPSPDLRTLRTVELPNGRRVERVGRKTWRIMDRLGENAFGNTPLEGIVLKRK